MSATDAEVLELKHAVDEELSSSEAEGMICDANRLTAAILALGFRKPEFILEEMRRLQASERAAREALAVSQAHMEKLRGYVMTLKSGGSLPAGTTL